MARGHQKIAAQQKNAKKKEQAKKAEGGNGQDKAVRVICSNCKQAFLPKQKGPMMAHAEKHVSGARAPGE